MKKFSQYIKEEENLQEGISKGDFVKDSQGNVHRVFNVMGNMLSVGKYQGDGKYGGTNSVHMSKVTKTQKPMEESVNEASESAMRNWVYRHLEKTDMPHDEMRKQFIKKYGAGNVGVFNKYVSEYMD